MSRVCLQCSTQNEDTAIICDYCSAELPQYAPSPAPLVRRARISPPVANASLQQMAKKLVCSACGHEALSGDLYCINCGAVLASVPPSPAPAQGAFASPAMPVPRPVPAAETCLVVGDKALPVRGEETRILSTGRLLIGDAEIPLPPLPDVTLGRQDPYAKPPWHPDVDLTAYGAGDPAYGVSRRHARLRWEGDWTIEDLSSANGTFVGGKRISQRTAVHDGDQITLGRLVMTFCAE